MHEGIFKKTETLLQGIPSISELTTNSGVSLESQIDQLQNITDDCLGLYYHEDTQTYMRDAGHLAIEHDTVITRVSRILVIGSLTQNMIATVQSNNVSEIEFHAEVLDDVVLATITDALEVERENPLTP